ncbi:putative Mg(2+) transport ATPase [Gemmata sp. SH-PL17]|uniref:MgtC/SapB family protein n=1 Tax=Gemmata sp. SH-PL17 TaxID=1630693 RepID=UPI00078E78FB|nr:MgtC/SapB family protein [Gemmata sp. SH-PL17]AMV28077.1 putative Mg(2+) transport ATPase [Gemmata sp. SH-PL17]
MSSWGQQIWSTVQEEFSDLPDAAQVTRVVLRLVIAAVLGGVLGYERESKGRAAGTRTHMLVAIGAALFVLIPHLSKVSDADLTRVLQGLVAGIGFLGAGTIVRGSGQEDVKGLTTAAGIWLTAAIGVAAGMGREATAVLATALALFVLHGLPKLIPSLHYNGSPPEDEAKSKK